jgi:hypothetical protein
MAERTCVDLTVEAPSSAVILPDQARNLTVSGTIKNCGDLAGMVEMSVELIINGRTISVANSTPTPLGAGESIVRTAELPIPPSALEGLQKALISVQMDDNTVTAQEVLINLIGEGEVSTSLNSGKFSNYSNPSTADQRECVDLTVEAPSSAVILPDQARNLTVSGTIKNCGDLAGMVEMSVELVINGRTISIANSTPTPLGAGESIVRTTELPIPPNAQEGLQKALVSVKMNDNTVTAQEVLVNLINGSEPAASSKTGLLDNYPNPFNASTSIRFSLAEPTLVRLEIYNVLGQKVRTLVNQSYPAGVYTITWDGKNASGKNVSSGVYFYNLLAGKHKETRSMQLIK